MTEPTVTTDLVAFLRARLDEDVTGAAYVHLDACASHPSEASGDSDQCDCGMPGRVLAEVEANRRTVELHSGAHECSSYNPMHREIDNCCWVMEDENCSTVRLRGLPYADHPDYREEWRP